MKRALVKHFWSAKFRDGGVATWMHEPALRRYINASVTGSENQWPLEWFKEWLGARTFERGLSLGCGTGSLERDIRRKKICRSVVGLDLSAEALRQAEMQAREEGLDGIGYRTADFNQLDLGSEKFDIIFFHQALHHVENLEGCLDTCRSALLPGGLIYLDEYVGPSRREWSRELMCEADAVYASLPAKLRRHRRMGLPVDWRDPSEAVRSSEILEQVGLRFQILEQRGYGSNLLALIYPNLELRDLSASEKEDVLLSLVEAERGLLARGIPSHCTVLVGSAMALPSMS
ncbi:MAG: class I SAM-dependent methyltransferase [Thermoanaerobaculia bacterium]|nr:class I SAM-dependent methyltransferase [Thermoanaerobaculia bacterium]